MIFKHFNLNHIELDEIDSTNSFLHGLSSKKNITTGTVVSTRNQTLGKGQKGNKWESKPNKNLTFSIFTTPNIDSSKAFYLNIISALAVQKTLSDLNIEAKIKWPNDILVNNKKICGILVENQIKGTKISQSIIGIGINVKQLQFNIDLKATSIYLEGKKVEITDIFSQVYGYLDFYYNLLKESNFKLLTKLYYNHLFWYNQIGTFSDNKIEFKALLKGITGLGFLELQTLDNQTKIVDIKDIKFIY